MSRNPAVLPYAKVLKRRAAAYNPWSVPQLCAAYAFPTGAPGRGPIAIVELGGGWRASDLTMFFEAMHLPAPTVTDVSVDGATNTPGQDADVEVALDIEVAGAAFAYATGVAAQIRVYWAQDIASAVLAAAKDGCAVCSISWGAAESAWGTADAHAMESAAAAATAAGMTVFAAAGDNDADDSSGAVAVDCPASCPHVVGCGGTSKPAGAAESVWDNDPDPTDPSGEGTGGGFSAFFPKQDWQVRASAAPAGLGRMVPDVSANADPQTGYEIVCADAWESVGGTSAVAPLYAGLFAALSTKGLGFVTPALFANPQCFADIGVGGNGLYQAAPGVPDPCTGMGVPVGQKLAELFGAAEAPPAPAPVPPEPPSPTPAPPPGAAVLLSAAQAWAEAGIRQGDALQTVDQAVQGAKSGLAAGWPQ